MRHLHVTPEYEQLDSWFSQLAEYYGNLDYMTEVFVMSLPIQEEASGLAHSLPSIQLA